MSVAADSILEFDPKLNPVPIVAVSYDMFDKVMDKAGDYAKTLANAVGFKADEGGLLYIPNDDGSMGRVYLGCGDITPCRQNSWFIAPAAEKLPDGVYTLDWDAEAYDLHEGALMAWAIASYRFDRYKTSKAPRPQLMAPAGVQVRAPRVVIDSSYLVKDLINTPTQDMGPAELEDVVASLAEEFGANITTIAGDDLLDENFPTIHAVGRAATDARAPRLIELNWSSSKANALTPKLSLVGKGVCFDTGGLNIKPGGGMRLMKKDMGGAAHAIGLARAIMATDMDVHIQLLIPAVENSISADAFRPGDVIRTRQGLTVEVGNTDAEGRLILCDALTYACEGNPDLVMDFATLTGAARVALGPDLPATFTNDDGLWGALETSAQKHADPIWRLPLWQNYRSMLKSSIADMSNISEGPFAGTITAALFLERFISKDTPWMHMDLFGWNATAKPGRPVGAMSHGIWAAYGAIKQRFSH